MSRHERKIQIFPLSSVHLMELHGILHTSQVKEKNVQNPMFPNILIMGFLHGTLS